MVNRSFKPLKTRSYFLFGPRGAGKSTWLREHYASNQVITFDLLDPAMYESLLLEPRLFSDIITSQENRSKLVIVDEVQRVPALLDIVHQLISKEKRTFILTGSSARRLKQKGVNLLAGRASVYHMYPLSMVELAEQFDLTKSLERGLLPEAYMATSDQEYQEYLKAYVITYIEKEIQQEQWVRKIEPFRKFLNIAAQMNAKVINKSKIAKQIGVESSTIESYFEILEDTLLGFRLSGFETSIRRQVLLADKFYFIDVGIVRAIEKSLTVPMLEHSAYYGHLFETQMVLEVKKFIEYSRLEWTLNYLCTKDGVEIDLIISRPKNSPILIEIKSSKKILDSDLKSITMLGHDLDKKFKAKCTKILASQDPITRETNGVRCCHYPQLISILMNLAQKVPLR